MNKKPNMLFLFSKLMTIREIRGIWTRCFSVILHGRGKCAETRSESRIN